MFTSAKRFISSVIGTADTNQRLKKLAKTNLAVGERVEHIASTISALERKQNEMVRAQKQSTELIGRMEAKLDQISKGLEAIPSQIASAEQLNYQQITRYLELRHRLQGSMPLPPLRGWSASPDLMVLLIELLEQYRPKSILELGSGASSIATARYASKTGAALLSIDHEEKFAEKTRDTIEKWGFSEALELRIASIIDNDGCLFYDKKVISSSRRSFDFVFLDGPPNKIQEKIRGNLLPLFSDLLQPGCLILLDDYYRKSEREVVRHWISEGLVELIEEYNRLEKKAALVRVR